MFYMIAAFLVLLWVIGMMSSNTMGGFIHSFPVLAVIAILLRRNIMRRVRLLKPKNKQTEEQEESL